MTSYNGYSIESKREHVVVTKDGKFVETADTIQEAIRDIDEMLF